MRVEEYRSPSDNPRKEVTHAYFLLLGNLSLASVASWALVRWVFQMPFSLPLGLIAMLWSAAVLLTLALGALGSRAVVRPPALVAIREAEAIG